MWKTGLSITPPLPLPPPHTFARFRMCPLDLVDELIQELHISHWYFSPINRLQKQLLIAKSRNEWRGQLKLTHPLFPLALEKCAVFPCLSSTILVLPPMETFSCGQPRERSSCQSKGLWSHQSFPQIADFSERSNDGKVNALVPSAGTNPRTLWRTGVWGRVGGRESERVAVSSGQVGKLETPGSWWCLVNLGTTGSWFMVNVPVQVWSQEEQ